MKTITVKLKINPQKFDAAQQFMEEKGLDINTESSKAAEASSSAPNGATKSGSGEPGSDSALRDFGSGGSYDD